MFRMQMLSGAINAHLHNYPIICQWSMRFIFLIIQALSLSWFMNEMS